MPANSEKRRFTYHTRVSVTRDQDRALSEYAALFGRVERTLYADVQKGKKSELLKSEYLVRFGLTARQFNAVKVQLEGKINAIRELLPVQIENLRRRIRKAKKTIAKLAKRLPGSQQLHHKKRRLAGLQGRLERRQADRKAGRLRLCFGSKKLFQAQFHLKANGFRSHAEWKQAWREARSNQFLVLGSKDETGGCQGCVGTRNEDGSYTLRVRLPHALRGKHLVISGVRLAYGQAQWEDSLACGRAVSYRFVRDQKSWRVLISTEVSPVERITQKRRGAIGIDINPDQLVVAEVDGSGNFSGGEHIPCVTYGKTQGQAKAIIGDVVKQAIKAAVQARKPIVIEQLEFAKKKAALEDEGTRRARMLSSFAYQQIIHGLKAAGFRAGVQVIEVNPAFTSTIGAVNYAARYGISIHQGAAIAIARRGLRLSERPAKRVAQVPTRWGGHVAVSLPVRTRGTHVWSFWLKVARQMRAAHAAPVRLLPIQSLGGTPAPRSSPGAVCYLTVYGETLHANRRQNRAGDVMA